MRGWWLRDPFFVRYMLREDDGRRVALYVIVLTVGLVLPVAGRGGVERLAGRAARRRRCCCAVLLVAMVVHAQLVRDHAQDDADDLRRRRRLAASTITRAGWAACVVAVDRAVGAGLVVAAVEAFHQDLLAAVRRGRHARHAARGGAGLHHRPRGAAGLAAVAGPVDLPACTRLRATGSARGSCSRSSRSSPWHAAPRILYSLHDLGIIRGRRGQARPAAAALAISVVAAGCRSGSDFDKLIGSRPIPAWLPRLRRSSPCWAISARSAGPGASPGRSWEPDAGRFRGGSPSQRRCAQGASSGHHAIGALGVDLVARPNRFGQQPGTVGTAERRGPRRSGRRAARRRPAAARPRGSRSGAPRTLLSAASVTSARPPVASRCRIVEQVLGPGFGRA